MSIQSEPSYWTERCRSIAFQDAKTLDDFVTEFNVNAGRSKSAPEVIGPYRQFGED